MSKIRKLDSQITNMIAAGEVVERPMGVVKELVENAIDANAKRISVAIEEGGIRKITVSDDGYGMDSEDAQMAFERHATSKIQSKNDLWEIMTLGFRGEALPSIASVAKVTLVTSDGEEGTKIVMEYGKRISASTYPSNQGTEISVEKLFYQTPARLKHMRSSSYETSLVQNVMHSFALSHPEISFVLYSDGKEFFRTSGQNNLKEVVYQVYGKAAAENAIFVEFEDFDYKVNGYIIKPSITRASRSSMHVFLNGRMVRTYRLYKAIQDGYEDFIVKGRYPLCVLHVEMDPHLLDVNVHPSKWEVRISKEKQLEYLIKDNVRSALMNTVLAPEKEIQEAKQYIVEPISFDTDQLIREADLQYNAKVEKQEIKMEEIPTQEIIQPKQEVVVQEVFPHMDVIGQLHDKFIICATKDGMAIIDQHAAQERVHYEEYCEKLNQNPVMIECLVPLTLHVGADVVSRVDELNRSIEDLHVQFEEFGKDTLVVREIPSWMKDVEEVSFLEDVIDQFKNDIDSKYVKMEKKKIATMACHHSIRFNRSLTMEEMKEVVRQLATCQNPYHCPHGRPTFIILNENQLVKEFLR